MKFMTKLWKLKIKPYNSGKLAEFICRLYMRLSGYRIIAKNYRCGSGKNTPCGEIDFIAVKKKRIVFCEVKKRNSSKSFWKALSYNQQQRILRGGRYFINANPQFKKYTSQYDVFWIRLPFSIKRFKNALFIDKTM